MRRAARAAHFVRGAAGDERSAWLTVGRYGCSLRQAGRADRLYDKSGGWSDSRELLADNVVLSSGRAAFGSEVAQRDEEND